MFSAAALGAISVEAVPRLAWVEGAASEAVMITVAMSERTSALWSIETKAKAVATVREASMNDEFQHRYLE